MELLFALLLFSNSPSFAEDFPENPQTLEDIIEKPVPQETTTEKIEKELDKSQTERKKVQYFALLNVSPFDLVIPNKYGATAGLAANSDRSWELEYVSGDFGVPFFLESIGEMRDERYSLVVRNYWGNSLNFSYGLTYYKFSGNVGSEVISRLPGTPPADVDVLSIKAWGVHVGVGNRWFLDNRISLGIDWFSWSQPFGLLEFHAPFLDYVVSQSDKDPVEEVLKYMSYFPRFTAFKIQIGMSF